MTLAFPGARASHRPRPVRRFDISMRTALVATALLILGVLAPASAVASTASDGQRVIADCSADGEVNGKYSQGAYKYALGHLPSDLAEYTNCTDAIRQAQAGAAGRNGVGGGGGGGTGGGFTGGGGGAIPGGSSFPAAPSPGALSPGEQSALQAARGAGGPVGIGGGAPVTPGGPGITASSVTRAVPGPLLALLILLGLGAAAGAAVAFRSRVLARRQA